MENVRLSKNALKCMYTASFIRLFVLGGLLGAIYYIFVFKKDSLFLNIVSIIVLILILIDAFINPYFRYNRYLYTINDECIDIKEGYLFKKRTIVPIERLHKLETRKGPIDQFFKVEKVILTTAGGEVSIDFLEEFKAEEIAESLRNRINEIVVKKREEIYEQKEI